MAVRFAIGGYKEGLKSIPPPYNQEDDPLNE